jgi:hypothetical protein
MPEMQDPHRRVLVAADMESYSRRSNVLQYRAQAAFRRIMEDATADMGLDRVDWLIQQGGDGELAILPPGTSERIVASRLAPVVDRLLREHNQGLAPEAKIRLRLGVHQGLVHLDGANGFPSDAPQLKQVLRDFPGADVALVVSDSLYHEVIEHYRDLRPEQFLEARAEIPDKGFSAAAWIYVPGENAAHATPRRVTPQAPPAQPEKPTAPHQAEQSFSGITTHGPAQFGNHNSMRNFDE